MVISNQLGQLLLIFEVVKFVTNNVVFKVIRGLNIVLKFPKNNYFVPVYILNQL